MSLLRSDTFSLSTKASREKPRKQRGRRPRKTKADASDPPTPAPSTPTQPQTPASIGEAAPPTPNRDTEVIPVKKVSPQTQPLPIASSQMMPTAQFPTNAPPSYQHAVTSQFQDANKTMAIQTSLQQGKPVSLPQQMSSIQRQHQMLAYSTATHEPPKTAHPAAVNDQGQNFGQPQGKHNPRMQAVSGQEWQQAQLAQMQHQTASSKVQTQHDVTRSQLPRVDIIPEGSNPFSDVYQELERKTRIVPKMPQAPIDSSPHAASPHVREADAWKNIPPSESQQTIPEQLTPHITQQPAHSTSSFYYPTHPVQHPDPNEGDTSPYFNQSRRATPLQRQTSSIQSPNFSQGQNIRMTIDAAHNSISTNVITQSAATVIHQSSHLSPINSQTPSASLQQQQQQQQHQQHWAVSGSVTAENSRLSAPPYTGIEHERKLHKQSSNVYPSEIVQSTYDRGETTPIDGQPVQPHIDNSNIRSPLHYPPGYSQQLQSNNATLRQNESMPSQTSVAGEPVYKEQAKSLQKRRKSGPAGHGNVDFSLLSPEEQRKFLLERKREDFERRQRLLEEQRQMNIKDQENLKGINKKVDKKIQKVKQQRKLKPGGVGAREKIPVAKSPVPGRLIIEDKSLKLPLCEPEVHLLYPLVQPFGSGIVNGERTLLGVFGNALLQGGSDYYAQFPSPNPPVTSSNPPTPPASLPPSPGTINQSLRDSLQMIPTEGIFDDMISNQRPKSPGLIGIEEQRDTSSPYYSSVIKPSLHTSRQSLSGRPDSQYQDQQSEDSKNDVLVTLTMSGDNQRTATERVTFVTDVIGAVKPESIQVVDEIPKEPNKAEMDTKEVGPTATSIGKENDVHFSCLDQRKPLMENDENRAPFCKHCDISIHGTGYIECRDERAIASDSVTITIDHVKYLRIPITTGIERCDIFCSQLCLRSYHSLSKSKQATADFLKAKSLYGDDSGQLIDPVRSVIPVSTGEPSNLDYLVSNSEDYEMRGKEQAIGSPVIIKRKSVDTQHFVSCFI